MSDVAEAGERPLAAGEGLMVVAELRVQVQRAFEVGAALVLTEQDQRTAEAVV